MAPDTGSQGNPCDTRVKFLDIGKCPGRDAVGRPVGQANQLRRQPRSEVNVGAGDDNFAHLEIGLPGDPVRGQDHRDDCSGARRADH